MKEQKQSPWKPILLVAGTVVCAIGGSMWRDRIEMGPAAGQATLEAAVSVPNESSGLVASLDAPVKNREGDMFYQVLTLVDENFVDPIADKQKVAVGGVKGMIQHLADPYALFMDDKQLAAYSGALKGKLQGIGAELKLRYDEEGLKKYRVARQKYLELRRKGKAPEVVDIDVDALLPEVVVAAVIPGSGADKAGLKPGDVIDKINDQFIWSARANKELDALRDEIRKPGTTDARYAEIRKLFMERADKSIMPGRALDKLGVGTEGKAQVTWFVGGGTQLKSAPVNFGLVEFKLKADAEGFVTPYFTQDGIAEILNFKTQDGTLKLDLRNLPSGDMGYVDAMLKTLLPEGVYGTVRNQKQNKVTPFRVAGSGDPNLKFELKSDVNTKGHAAILAHALMKTGRAKLIGPVPPKTAPIEELIKLSDGSGYLLPTGMYAAEVTK